MFARTKLDRSREHAESAAPNRRRAAKGLAVAVVLCLAAALLPAAVQAHDGETEAYTYEVQVEKTREVPVYEWVEEPVTGTREVPVYGWVEEPVMGTRDVPVYGWVPTEVEVQKTREVPVYENRLTVKCGILRTHPDDPGKRVCWPETVKVQTGTRTETYTVTETRRVWKQTGTRTETYDTGTTRRVWKQTGTKTETYTDISRTRRVQKQIGTRTETYTDTETRTGTRTVHDDGCTSPSQPSQHSTAPANHRAVSIYYDDYGHNCVTYRSTESQVPSLGDIAKSVAENVEKALETTGTTLQEAVETAVRTANRLVCSSDGQILTAAAFGTMAGIVTANIAVGAGAGVGATYYLRETCEDLYPTTPPAPTATAEPTAQPTVQPTAAPTPEPTAAATPKPTAAPTSHPDHQKPPAEYTRVYCRTIGNYRFCHYYTPGGWTQRTHVD